MRWPAVFTMLAAVAGCEGGVASGPFDALPLDGSFDVGLGAPVHVARDRYGIAHITGQALGDAAFVQGYVIAHDRLPQMDLLRRLAAGRLAELFGASDPAVIDGDLAMRLYRMVPLAEATWTQLQASAAPIDGELVTLLSRFADGVNAYASDLQAAHWTLDAEVAASLPVGKLSAWSPVDSLAILRLYLFAQSQSLPFEIDATELYQKLRAAFDDADPSNAAAVARRGISRDLLRFAPVVAASTIPDFPNVAVDTGSRADASAPGPGTRASARSTPDGLAAASAARPEVPEALLDAAHDFFTGAGAERGHPLAALGPLGTRQPLASGNSWVVGAPRLPGGAALLAADPHLPLTNPSLLYPTHLIVAPAPDNDGGGDAAAGPGAGALDLLGATVPGIPGIVLGTNGQLAWAATANEHDVADLYLEHIAPCDGGTGDCVAWTDAQGTSQSVPIESSSEDIAVGALGEITGHVTATYERVPHHGPIIPAIDRVHHALVTRTGATALSLRATWDAATFELRALLGLAHARDVATGFMALDDVTAGGLDWTMIDGAGHIGWSAQADVPVRAPAAYSWDPLTQQDAPAPFFVLPGDGSAEWSSALSPRYLPHAADPAQGYLVVTAADPVGATFDGRPLDQATNDGAPLYLGVRYAAGLRQGRITSAIEAATAGGAAGGDATSEATSAALEALAAIQRDTHSSTGEAIAPALRTALARLDSPTGSPVDLAPYVAGLAPADRARLDTARGLFDAWSFQTPAAPTSATDADSAATALFHTWVHYFVGRTLADELAAIGFDPWRLDSDLLIRIVHAMLTDPHSFVTSPATQQPILCDDYAATGPDVSCTVQILAAMIDAMTHLESPDGFATPDTRQWRWGALHRLAIAPLVSDAALNLPGPGDADPAGFPRAGDGFAVDRLDPGWSDLAFPPALDGPAQRFVAEVVPGRQPGVPQDASIAVHWALPGGTIFDHRSPHYRDLLDGSYLTGAGFDAPYAIADIVAAGETRWVFQ